jgi:DNA-directed RNA polymerase specialized sigma24 family protein
MEVPTDLLDRARSGKRQAIVEILAMFYPVVHRIAHGISGREDVGRGVVRWVMKTSVSQVDRWQDESGPQRWFLHHTILTLRRASKHKPELTSDPLIQFAETTHAYYPAFIRALRSLAKQQQEAFILHHGERFNPRYMAVAMDCSTEAASTHLREATNSLSALSGDMFAAFTAQLAHAYNKLTPDQSLVLDNVKVRVRRFLFPRRLMKAFSNLTTLAMLAAIVWFAWKIWPMLKW